VAPFTISNNNMILTAIERAYRVMHERKWDTIYWAVDLHGVCLKSNYENGGYSFINEAAKTGLQAISQKQENVIILWSSCHDHEKKAIKDFFSEHHIIVDYFNENPDEANTKTGCFDQKFYFSILLDDKAGFDPDIHWQDIINFYKRDADEISRNTSITRFATSVAGGAALGLLAAVLLPKWPLIAVSAFLIGSLATADFQQYYDRKA
jgi:hypothetical protein